MISNKTKITSNKEIIRDKVKPSLDKCQNHMVLINPLTGKNRCICQLTDNYKKHGFRGKKKMFAENRIINMVEA